MHDDIEALFVPIAIENMPVKVISAYGPPEGDLKEKKEKFLNFLGEEVIKTELRDHRLLIQIGGNLHSGPTLISIDPNLQNSPELESMRIKRKK